MVWIIFVVLGALVILGCLTSNDGGNTPKEITILESPQKMNPQIEKSEQKVPMQKLDGREFELRLRRARTEAFKIVEFYEEADEEVDILSVKSGHVYRVSMTKCTCEDYKKGHLPCKHMIYFALHTGRYVQLEKAIPSKGHPHVNRENRMIPLYWEYYDGKPTGIGYTNLYPYKVCGRSFGVSEKTGKQTNRKKAVLVNAISREDAITAAQKLNCMPPYAEVELVDIAPSESQYGYLYGAEIPFPNLVSAADAGALLTRYEDENDHRCSRGLLEMATQHRVRVSYFQEPESVVTCVWDGIAAEEKAAMFCYAVYCKEMGYPFGSAPIKSNDSVFSNFKLTKKQQDYILKIQEFGWTGLNKRTTSYQSAYKYLEQENLLKGKR